MAFFRCSFICLVYFRLDIPYLNEGMRLFTIALVLIWHCLALAFPRRGGVYPNENTKKKSAFSPSLLLLSALLCYGYTILGKTIGLLLLATVFYRISYGSFLASSLPKGLFCLWKKYADHNFYLYAVHYLFLSTLVYAAKAFFSGSGRGFALLLL